SAGDSAGGWVQEPARGQLLSRQAGKGPADRPAGRADWGESQPDRQLAVEPGLFGLRSPDRAFVVKVRGRSMEGAGIRDGDLAVLEKKEPREGDVVAALVDGEVTLKRLVNERRGWFLKSENPEFPDLTPRRDLQVQGVLVGLVRRWKC
ncbi:MAG: hypothetical protein EBT95_11100, partial [Verrucomicrobia bacterium]|nr:hypothetical protein [Verrucomicrobiota bacterium]